VPDEKNSHRTKGEKKNAGRKKRGQSRASWLAFIAVFSKSEEEKKKREKRKGKKRERWLQPGPDLNVSLWPKSAMVETKGKTLKGREKKGRGPSFIRNTANVNSTPVNPRHCDLHILSESQRGEKGKKRKEKTRKEKEKLLMTP